MGPGTRTSTFGVFAFALVVVLAFAPVAEAKRIVGNKGANVLKGTNVRDDVFGRDGKDVLIGFGGNDWIYGEAGDDVLLGEKGADRLWGGGRDDTIHGGPGGDRIWAGWGSDVVDAGPGNDIVDANENDASMDSIDCGAGWDTVYVNRRDRVFNCEVVKRVRPRNGTPVPGRLWVDVDGIDEWDVGDPPYRDLLVGLGGDDKLFSHTLQDMLWGNDGNDMLFGGHGPDLLLGGSGNDMVYGDGGDDRLWGGLGFDEMHGGDRNDELISIENDGEPDEIDCGLGRDRAVIRPNDVVIGGCERVIRITR